MMRLAVRHAPFVLALALLSGCAAAVDLNAVPEAKAGCEPPGADELVPKPPMLPGRRCGACHVAGGQAGTFVWTAAGTVFGSLGAKCNTGGLEGVTVELIDGHGPTLITLTTDRTGNFFTSEDIDLSLFRARVSKNGKSKMMNSLQSTGDCGLCHYPGGLAGGRIYLD